MNSVSVSTYRGINTAEPSIQGRSSSISTLGSGGTATRDASNTAADTLTEMVEASSAEETLAASMAFTHEAVAVPAPAATAARPAMDGRISCGEAKVRCH